jgi:hypothetical protein
VQLHTVAQCYLNAASNRSSDGITAKSSSAIWPHDFEIHFTGYSPSERNWIDKRPLLTRIIHWYAALRISFVFATIQNPLSSRIKQRIRHITLSVTLSLLGVCAVLGQSQGALRFDVASIRRNNTSEAHIRDVTAQPVGGW